MFLGSSLPLYLTPLQFLKVVFHVAQVALELTTKSRLALYLRRLHPPECYRYRNLTTDADAESCFDKHLYLGSSLGVNVI